MKKSELLELNKYEVIRYFRGNDWNGKKVYIYILKMQDGTEYRIRKYDLKDFIARGATYTEKN